MKKLIITLLIVIALTGCNKQTTDNTVKNTNNNNEVTESINDVYIDNNPITVGIYKYHNNYTNRELLSTYIKNWNEEVDIGSFEIFFTNEPTISSKTFKNLWYDYYYNYENISEYKIGYNLKLTINNEKEFNINILTPNDTKIIFDYLQIYLYDDINQEDNAWYSHITDEEMNNNTRLTSIKLSNGDSTDQITSDIILTAFTYDSDDFDEFNNYIGKSYYTITIKRK